MPSPSLTLNFFSETHSTPDRCVLFKTKQKTTLFQEVWLHLILTQAVKNLSGKQTGHMKEIQAAADSSLVEK